MDEYEFDDFLKQEEEKIDKKMDNLKEEYKKKINDEIRKFLSESDDFIKSILESEIKK